MYNCERITAPDKKTYEKLLKVIDESNVEVHNLDPQTHQLDVSPLTERFRDVVEELGCEVTASLQVDLSLPSEPVDVPNSERLSAIDSGNFASNPDHYLNWMEHHDCDLAVLDEATGRIQLGLMMTDVHESAMKDPLIHREPLSVPRQAFVCATADVLSWLRYAQNSGEIAVSEKRRIAVVARDFSAFLDSHNPGKLKTLRETERHPNEGALKRTPLSPTVSESREVRWQQRRARVASVRKTNIKELAAKIAEWLPTEGREMARRQTVFIVVAAEDRLSRMRDRIDPQATRDARVQQRLNSLAGIAPAGNGVE